MPLSVHIINATITVLLPNFEIILPVYSLKLSNFKETRRQRPLNFTNIKAIFFSISRVIPSHQQNFSICVFGAHQRASTSYDFGSTEAPDYSVFQFSFVFHSSFMPAADLSQLRQLKRTSTI